MKGNALPDLEKRAKVTALARQKKSQVEIARELGVTPAAVCQMLKRIFGDLEGEIIENAAQLRREQLEGLKALLRVSLRRALQGDLYAYDRALKTYERASKLMGLDSATEFELAGKGGVPLATPVILLPAIDDEPEDEQPEEQDAEGPDSSPE